MTEQRESENLVHLFALVLLVIGGSIAYSFSETDKLISLEKEIFAATGNPNASLESFSDSDQATIKSIEKLAFGFTHGYLVGLPWVGFFLYGLILLIIAPSAKRKRFFMLTPRECLLASLVSIPLGMAGFSLYTNTEIGDMIFWLELVSSIISIGFIGISMGGLIVERSVILAHLANRKIEK